jgi:hypothetical protein
LYADKENEPKERAADHLACGSPVLLEMTGSLKTREVYAQQGCSNSLSSFIGHFCGARLREMAIKNTNYFLTN